MRFWTLERANQRSSKPLTMRHGLETRLVFQTLVIAQSQRIRLVARPRKLHGQASPHVPPPTTPCPLLRSPPAAHHSAEQRRGAQAGVCTTPPPLWQPHLRTRSRLVLSHPCPYRGRTHLSSCAPRGACPPLPSPRSPAPQSPARQSLVRQEPAQHSLGSCNGSARASPHMAGRPHPTGMGWCASTRQLCCQLMQAGTTSHASRRRSCECRPRIRPQPWRQGAAS